MDNNQLLRWKDAADAAKTIVDLHRKQYTFSTHYSTLLSAFDNAKIILTSSEAASNTFEGANYPTGFDKRQIGINSSRHRAGACKVTAAGKSITDRTSNGKPANPYPDRATLSVKYCNQYGSLSTVSAVTRPFQIYFGSKDGEPVYNAAKTGVVE